MTADREPLRWTPEDVERRLATVREVLLDFLKERTRLDWFKHKLRWRLSKRYIWPGAPEGLDGLLEEAIERDGGVEAFKDYLQTRQRAIVDAIERYNTALQRLMEQEQGAPAERFDEAAAEELRHRRSSSSRVP
jgi:hypothetical protein